MILLGDFIYLLEGFYLL